MYSLSKCLKWVTLFAYGQSGSGKTYTLFGKEPTLYTTPDEDELEISSGSKAKKPVVSIFIFA